MSTRWWRRGDRRMQMDRCPVTGALTPSAFVGLVSEKTADPAQAAHAVVSVDVLDLDRLAFAHGDDAATEAVTALGATLAEIGGVGPDRVCLLGDGRIAVALHGLPADAADGRALNVAWSLVAAAATAVRAGDVPVRLDVAVGVSTSTEPIAGELLVRRAELATLDAGTIGRNVTRLFGVRFKPSFAADELGDDVVADDEDLLAALAAHEV